MKSCSFCGNKTLKDVKTEYIYKKDNKYLIIDAVPAKECSYCGEKYFKADVLKSIENEFNKINNGTKKITKELLVPTENFCELESA
jgi:YgiT-type zinc finger domain-containing protein